MSSQGATNLGGIQGATQPVGTGTGDLTAVTGSNGITVTSGAGPIPNVALSAAATVRTILGISEVLIDDAVIAALATSYTSPSWAAAAFRELRVEYFVDNGINVTFTYPGLAGYYSVLTGVGGTFSVTSDQYLLAGAGITQQNAWGEFRCLIKKTGFDRTFVSHGGQRDLTTTVQRVQLSSGGTTDVATDITQIRMDFSGGGLVVGGNIRVWGIF